jgi:hypothetical protein
MVFHGFTIYLAQGVPLALVEPLYAQPCACLFDALS